MILETVFRLAKWDSPFWINPNRRPSRFGIEGSITQYWSLHPLAPWAEQLKFHDIRQPDEALELRLRPWVARLELPEDVLRVNFDNARDHGIEPVELTSDVWTACQEWASTLRRSAIIVPSAALAGTENLVLFGPRVRAPYGVRAIDPSIDVQCDPVADQSTGLVDLLPHVRWYGAPHGGYEAWESGLDPPLPPDVRVDRL